MSSNDVANQLTVGEDGRCFHFGIDREKAADRLREIADKLDSQEILIQRFTEYGHANADDFALQGLVLKFALRTEPKAKPEKKELHGAGSPLPFAVAHPSEEGQ